METMQKMHPRLTLGFEPILRKLILPDSHPQDCITDPSQNQTAVPDLLEARSDLNVCVRILKPDGQPSLRPPGESLKQCERGHVLHL